MSRSSHLDHPGSQASLFSLFLAFSPEPLVRPQPPNSELHHCSARSSSVSFTALSRRSPCPFFSYLLYLLVSLFFFLPFSPSPLLSHIFFFFSIPLPSSCAPHSLKETVPRNFPTLGKKSAFEHGNWGFQHPSGRLFYYKSNFLTWNISPCVWQHDEMKNEKRNDLGSF